MRIKQHTVKQPMESKISRKILKYFELNINVNITYQNLWDVVKEVIREIVIALNACIRKEERCKINNLSFHHRKLEREQIEYNVSRKIEIKIREKIYF